VLHRDRRVVGERDRPDIAIEVIWTSGDIDKLEVYRKLGVREVWYYERGTLRFFALRGERGREGYAEIPQSGFLPPT
jgi:Uma2 family endonuclease